MSISNTGMRNISGPWGAYPQVCKISWQKGNFHAHTGEVEIPEVWLQAQASVQTQLDSEVMAEAAELAEAQWGEMTLVARFTQARGERVDLDVCGSRCTGTLTEVSASGEFILLTVADGESARTRECLIRTSCINSARGLPRGLAPVAESLARARIGFREGSWMRGQWGNRVSIRIQHCAVLGHPEATHVHGRVAAVGRDFIEIDNGERIDQRLVVALASVISMKVAQ